MVVEGRGRGKEEREAPAGEGSSVAVVSVKGVWFHDHTLSTLSILPVCLSVSSATLGLLFLSS